MSKSSQSKQGSRHEIIAHRLLIEISRSSSECLPSIFTLAKQYNTAKDTMAKALHFLAAQGVITISRGKENTIRIVRNNTASCQEPIYAEKTKKLCEKIESEIIQGTRKVGQQLPKLDYYAKEEHMGRQSVQEAYRLLSEKELVHKEGRSWLVGPHCSLNYRSNPANRPVVVLICPDFSGWIYHWQKRQTVFHSFCDAFSEEVEKIGYDLALAYMDAKSTDAYIPRGKKAVLAYIRSLNSRYAGTFFFSVRSETPDEWIRLLVKFRKPVVLFEASGGELDLQQETISAAGANLLWCKFNQQELVETAVNALARLGHVRVGSVRIGPEATRGYMAWTNLRAELIVASAKNCVPPLILKLVKQDEPFVLDQSWLLRENFFLDYLNSRAKSLCETAKSVAKDRIISETEAIKQCFPSLAKLIDVHRVTAIIAPNDFLARMYKIWLKECGISIPCDISLIGFDNDMRSRHFEISSIDPGLGKLGYLAAHYIIGDIPVAVGKSRVLNARCSLFDRGSIGPPKRAAH